MGEGANFRELPFDLLIHNARLIDPSSGIDQKGALAVRNGRIAAVGNIDANAPARKRLDAGGRIVCPGLIDLHTHVFEWVTNFGVNADQAGVHAGVTTLVDAGSSGAWTFGAFNQYVIEPSKTDVRAFVSINVAGALKGGMKGDVLHNPLMTDVDDVVKLVAEYPQRVKGIKCHAESGALSHWGLEVLQMASRAGKEAQVPLYVHTGELFPVIEASRPQPDTVVDQVLPLLKKGDVLAHFYSSMPDGIIGRSDKVPDVVYHALEAGLHFDIGYGLNFNYRIARLLMAENLLPYTISSDVHGDFNSYHDLSKLDYSLCGAMSRLHALGMPLMEVIRRTTLHPALVLGEADEIGTLGVGTRADITILELVNEDWVFLDGRGESLETRDRFVPHRVIRAGEVIVPSNELLPDVLLRDMAKRRRTVSM